MSKGGVERRRYRRTDVDAPIVYQANGCASYDSGRLLDIGAGGARLSISSECNPGDSIQFRLNLKQRNASAWGRIAWTRASSDGPTQVGVRFAAWNPELVGHLQAL